MYVYVPTLLVCGVVRLLAPLYDDVMSKCSCIIKHVTLTENLLYAMIIIHTCASIHIMHLYVHYLATVHFITLHLYVFPYIYHMTRKQLVSTLLKVPVFKPQHNQWLSTGNNFIPNAYSSALDLLCTVGVVSVHCPAAPNTQGSLLPREVACEWFVQFLLVHVHTLSTQFCPEAICTDRSSPNHHNTNNTILVQHSTKPVVLSVKECIVCTHRESTNPRLTLY